MKKLRLIVLITVVLMLMPQSAIAQSPIPNDVLDTLVEALNGGDIEALMAIHTEDAVYHINPPPPGAPDTYVGSEAVRGWLEGLIANNTAMAMRNQMVEGSVITADGWHTDEGLRAMGVNAIEGLAKYTVVDGKIMQLDWTTTPESVAAIDSAVAALAAPDLIKIVDARADAVNQGDLERALAVHTEDAVYHINPPPAGAKDTYTGLAEIEGWLQRVLEGNGTVTLSDYRVEGNVVTARSSFTTDSFSKLGIDSLEAIEQFTIVDGKIADFAWAALPESQAQLDAAVAARIAPDLVALVNARAEAFNAGDLETMMTFYAEDAEYRIVPLPGRSPGTYVGIDEIRGRLDVVLADNPTLEVTIRKVEDNVVTAFTRHSDKGLQDMGVDFIEGVEEYTIVDGKITDFVWNTTDESLARIGAAIRAMSDPHPADIVLDHIMPMNEGDLVNALSYLAEDVVVEVILFPGEPDVYHGIDEIESWFAHLVEMNFENHIAVIYTEGDTVVTYEKTYNDFTRETGIAPLEGFGVYTVEDSLITSFTWTSTDESRAALATIIAADE